MLLSKKRFNYHMSYAELSASLDIANQSAHYLTVTELYCIQRSLEDSFLVKTLELYPLAQSSYHLVERSVLFGSQGNVLWEQDDYAKLYAPGHNHHSFLHKNDDVITTIILGITQHFFWTRSQILLIALKECALLDYMRCIFMLVDIRSKKYKKT